MSKADKYEHYSVIIEWDPVDHIYVVTVPELPGCMTHGASLEEAARQARDAIETWIDGAREDGDALPKARYYELGTDSSITHKSNRVYRESQKASRIGL